MSDASNFDKSWLQNSINQAAIARAMEAIQVMGRALPCSVVAVSGSIVTIAFQVQSAPFTLPQVTIPKAESQWIRTPTQIGDYGIAVPAQTFLGAIDGLGSGTATLALQGNLSNLYFLPISSATFPAADTTAALVCGPNGAVIKDTGGKTLISVDGEGNVTLHGINSWGWDVNGYGYRITYTGGSTFRQDNYTTGATVTQVNHAWTPPGPV